MIAIGKSKQSIIVSVMGRNMHIHVTSSSNCYEYICSSDIPKYYYMFIWNSGEQGEQNDMDF
jgi:hypothetical protein